jgi:hypothetical protein
MILSFALRNFRELRTDTPPGRRSVWGHFQTSARMMSRPFNFTIFAGAITAPIRPDDFWPRGWCPASDFDFQVALLTSPITAKRITAPMTALIISAPMPPTKTNPIRGKATSQPWPDMKEAPPEAASCGCRKMRGSSYCFSCFSSSHLRSISSMSPIMSLSSNSPRGSVVSASKTRYRSISS